MALRLITSSPSESDPVERPREPSLLVVAEKDLRSGSEEGALVGLLPLAIQRISREEPIDATLPRLARELLQLCNDPDASVREISQLLSRDPSLAACAVAKANSAFFRGRVGPVEAVSDAVIRVGAQGIKSIVLAPRIKARLVDDPVSRSLWSHSVAVASVTPFISSLARVNSEAAYLAGLLHDLGRIILWMDARSFRSQYTPEALKLAIDELHEEVGRTLLERWEMPDSLVAAVGYHHHPPFVCAAEADRLAHAVCLADTLLAAHERGEVPEFEEMTSALALDIRPHHLDTLWAHLPEISSEVSSS